MSITKDVNLGTIVPIIMFLIVQTGGGIWWASSVHSAVNTLSETVEKMQSNIDDENLRQWARINSLEVATQTAMTEIAATNVALNSIKENIQELRYDMRQNNDLIREMLANRGPRHGNN